MSKVSALSLTSQKRQGRKITMVTAYDYPSAVHLTRAKIDIILVGDSCSMVELGHETTQPITIDEMLHHSSAVKRGVDYAHACASSRKNSSTTSTSADAPDQKPHVPLLIGDMPFGSYEFDDTDIALRNAYRFVKEAGMDAVKLEVSSRTLAFIAVHFLRLLLCSNGLFIYLFQPSFPSSQTT